MKLNHPFFTNYIIHSNGTIFSSRSNTFIKHHINNKGYSIVTLSDGKLRKTATVARLIAETFIPNPNNLPQINHKNGDKNNDTIENLEWCTGKENVCHAYTVLGRIQHRKIDKSCHLTIKEKYKNSKKKKDVLSDLSNKYGASEYTIRAIACGYLVY